VLKKFFLILAFLACSLYSFPQGWLTDENNFETNWNFTFQIGPTILINELKKDFSGAGNDMNNYPDLGYSFQLAKMVWERVDLGFEYCVSNFKGSRSNPSNVNYLMLSGHFNNSKADFVPYPIYYNSSIISFVVYSKYNFINLSSFSKGFIKVNLYAKMGIGIAFISAEMGYSNPINYELTGLENPLFVVGKNPNPIKNSYPTFNPAFGINYQLSERVFVSGEMSFQVINADYVDGILNFNNKLTPEVDNTIHNKYRVPVYDITGKFMIGVTYFFNFDSHRQIREKEFPWYYSKYRSYYSKFQTPSTKKAQKERLPFYNLKFEE
jgi:hypothetical protein